MRASVAAWVFVVVVGCRLATAQPAGPADNQPATKPAVVTRVYNVEDLVRPAKDYPLETSMRLPSQVEEQQPYTSSDSAKRDRERYAEESSKEERDNLVQLIRETVSPESWRDNGGEIGSIRIWRDKLIVAQTDAVQREISVLLEDLRRRSTRAVHLRATWLYVSPDQLDGLWDKAAGPKNAGAVDPASLAKLAKDALWGRAEMDCTDGQMVHVTSGRVRNMVQNVSPIVGEHTTGFSPYMALIQSGVALQARPQISGDGQRASVDLKAFVGDAPEKAEPITINSAPAASTQPAAASGRPSEVLIATIDRLNVGVQQFATTARIPLGKPVLVGGMTLEPTGKGNGKQLYLILEVTAGE